MHFKLLLGYLIFATAEKSLRSYFEITVEQIFCTRNQLTLKILQFKCEILKILQFKLEFNQFTAKFISYLAGNLISPLLITNIGERVKLRKDSDNRIICSVRFSLILHLSQFNQNSSQIVRNIYYKLRVCVCVCVCLYLLLFSIRVDQ